MAEEIAKAVRIGAKSTMTRPALEASKTAAIDRTREERHRNDTVASLRKIEVQTGRLVTLTAKLLKRFEKPSKTIFAVKDAQPLAASRKAREAPLIQAEKSRVLPPRDARGRFAKIAPAEEKYVIPSKRSASRNPFEQRRPSITRRDSSTRATFSAASLADSALGMTGIAEKASAPVETRKRKNISSRPSTTPPRRGLEEKPAPGKKPVKAEKHKASVIPGSPSVIPAKSLSSARSGTGIQTDLAKTEIVKPEKVAPIRDEKGRFGGKSKSEEKEEQRRKEKDNRTFLRKIADAVKDPFGAAEALDLDRSELKDEVGAAMGGTAYDMAKELTQAANDPMIKKTVGALKSLRKKGEDEDKAKDAKSDKRQPAAKAKRTADAKPSKPAKVASAKETKAAVARTDKVTEAVGDVRKTLEEAAREQEKRDAKAEKAEDKRHREMRQAVAESGDDDGILDTVTDLIPGGGLLKKVFKGGGLLKGLLKGGGIAAGVLGAGALGGLIGKMLSGTHKESIRKHEAEKRKTPEQRKREKAQAVARAETEKKRKAGIDKAETIADALRSKPASSIEEIFEREAVQSKKPKPEKSSAVMRKSDSSIVIPAQAGIQTDLAKMDSRPRSSRGQALRGNDKSAERPFETQKPIPEQSRGRALRQRIGSAAKVALGLRKKESGRETTSPSALKSAKTAIAVRESASPLLGGDKGVGRGLGKTASLASVQAAALPRSSFLPSPLRSASGRKTPGGPQTRPKLAMPGKIDVKGFQELLNEVRRLNRKVERLSASDSPDPLHDPFLKETIAEADKAFDTWS